MYSHEDYLREYFEDKGKEVIDIMVALYDEQEVLDRHISNKEIQAAVEAIRFMGASQQQTADYVVKQYNLRPDVAMRKVQEFWD